MQVGPRKYYIAETTAPSAPTAISFLIDTPKHTASLGLLYHVKTKGKEHKKKKTTKPNENITVL